MTGGGVLSPPPPIGLSPPGVTGVTGGVPATPGVVPVLAGTVGVIVALGVGAAVGSWCAVAELTAVVMVSRGMFERSGSGILGMRGSPVDFGWWWCSAGW
ncbi:hypothetical protein [Mycobacteroides abscessus]|uniref:hypothetical protein n=1 Tax=Mycobacteroides abscessus TaxID=36809 RepID=UPI001F40CF06|nr:hypothetical protein [Mycobacteroides abscessus]